ncbi:SRPBCC family protein [Intrasporangium sp. YIM S08009]|uniref:SRPBCC family protein n=1 Tax=Intrasporangium zincisolvens TaxID=3080018 RepID=UPI002B0544A5|nr:SRPBCC family protein [Intrasporangium sp. YIM S08009]
MELTHSFTVPTSVDDAWALFMDLERVGGCFPGATVTEVTADGFSGTVKVKLGPIALVYAGSGSFVERDDAAHRAVIAAKGKDKRGNGTAGATVTIGLAPDGDGTRADVTTDLAVTGKPAQFGRGVMQDVSDKLLQAFVACIEKQLGESVAGAGEPAPEPAGSEPAATEPGGAGAPTAEAGAAAGATPVAAPGAPTKDATAPAAAPRPTRPASVAPPEDDALDLGTAVLPVLVQRYAPYAGAALVGLVLGWLLGRRRGG